MAHIHDHGTPGTTVVEEREGTSAALIVAIVLVLIGFMVWLFGFSGIVFDRGTDRNPTKIEFNGGNSSGGTSQGGNSNPSPIQS